MIDKNEYLKSIQDKVRSEEQEIELRLSAFRRAGNSIEYKTALQEIPFLKEPEALKKGMQLLKNKQEDTAVRLLILQKALSAIGKNTEYIRDCLFIAQDNSDQIELRRAILTVLKALSFGSKLFVSLRVEYMTMLRSLLDDPDTLLRETAAEELAKDKDEYVQRRLLSGLTGQEDPIVNTAKAIQLLGYDIHAEHYPIVREILQDPASNETVKVEAIHVLASDPVSKPLLMNLTLDKGQEKEVRMSSAAAIQSTHSDDFFEIAKSIVLDEAEEKSIRAVCLNLLMYHRNKNALYDLEFTEKVNRLHSSTQSNDLKKLSIQYLKSASDHNKKQ